MGRPVAEQAELVSHCDYYPGNVVFRGGLPVALIDFDLAHPTTRLYDIANALWYWAPLRDPRNRAPAFADADIPHRVAYYAAAAVSVAVLMVFIQRRFAQAAVAGLVVELGTRGAAVDLREALSRALGDPSLTLAYWYPAESRYVDSDGRPVELPETDATRRSTAIERDGQPVAALIHDPALQYNPKLADAVCAAAGLSLNNERLAAELRARLVELQASRARLVTAADEARRRIERDLHDGAQQQLVALKISLGLARQLVESSPDDAADLLAQAERQATDALEELRELARGIYPPVLADLGLHAALEAQARKAAVPVTVEAPTVHRYPHKIEAAVYFCVLEGLQNVAKYAQASAARVTLRSEGQRLVFTIEDNGEGFDPAITPKGTGLQGISDRLAALGGTIDIVAVPGHGTRITGQLPIVPADDMSSPAPPTEPPKLDR